PSPESPGSQNHEAAVMYGDLQVVDRHLLVERDGGAAEVRNLVLAKDGTQQHVAETPLGQMDDFGEHGLGIERFLGVQVANERLHQGNFAVAVAARKLVSELPESVAACVGAPVQEGHAADDLSKDGASEVGTDDRLEHVDLEQTRQLDCRREFREEMRYAEVA